MSHHSPSRSPFAQLESTLAPIGSSADSSRLQSESGLWLDDHPQPQPSQPSKDDDVDVDGQVAATSVPYHHMMPPPHPLEYAVEPVEPAGSSVTEMASLLELLSSTDVPHACCSLSTLDASDKPRSFRARHVVFAPLPVASFENGNDSSNMYPLDDCGFHPKKHAAPAPDSPPSSRAPPVAPPNIPRRACDPMSLGRMVSSESCSSGELHSCGTPPHSAKELNATSPFQLLDMGEVNKRRAARRASTASTKYPSPEAVELSCTREGAQSTGSRENTDDTRHPNTCDDTQDPSSLPSTVAIGLTVSPSWLVRVATTHEAATPSSPSLDARPHDVTVKVNDDDDVPVAAQEPSHASSSSSSRNSADVIRSAGGKEAFIQKMRRLYQHGAKK